MKHKVNPKGSILAASLTLLAMTISLLVPHPAHATSCEKILSLPQSITNADVVFTGKYDGYQMIWMDCNSENCKSYSDDKGYYLVATTYIADNILKGSLENNKATIISSWPIPPHMKEAFKEDADKIAEQKDTKIFALKKVKISADEAADQDIKHPEQLEKYYQDPVCGGEYDVTPDNIQVLEKRFPKVPVQ